MDDSDELTDLLIDQHALAVAVSKGLAALHARAIEDFVGAVSASPAWEALERSSENRGGSVRDWGAPVDGLPGHWWAGYLPPLPGAKQTEYGAGLGGYVSDHDGRLAITVYVQMNMRLSGISGAEFRAGVDDLPEGDSGEWLNKGRLSRTTPAAGPDVAVLVATAVDVAETYLAFANRLTAEIAQQRGQGAPAAPGSKGADV